MHLAQVYMVIVKTPLQRKFKNRSTISLYAATKKSNELMAHVYSHLYSIETIDYVFLLYMVNGEDLIWHTICSQMQYLKNL